MARFVGLRTFDLCPNYLDTGYAPCEEHRPGTQETEEAKFGVATPACVQLLSLSQEWLRIACRSVSSNQYVLIRPGLRHQVY